MNRIINSVKNRVNTYLYQTKDLSLKRKIVVIESDDWGAIRMPSKEVYKELGTSFNFSNCHYCMYDSILTNNDLDALANTFLDIKNDKDNSPKITANFVTVNPDFQKIKKADFTKYYSESIITTIDRYKDVEVDTISDDHGKTRFVINELTGNLKSAKS